MPRRRKSSRSNGANAMVETLVEVALPEGDAAWLAATLALLPLIGLGLSAGLGRQVAAPTCGTADTTDGTKAEENLKESELAMPEVAMPVSLFSGSALARC